MKKKLNNFCEGESRFIVSSPLSCPITNSISIFFLLKMKWIILFYSSLAGKKWVFKVECDGIEREHETNNQQPFSFNKLPCPVAVCFHDAKKIMWNIYLITQFMAISVHIRYPSRMCVCWFLRSRLRLYKHLWLWLIELDISHIYKFTFMCF